LRHYRPQYLSGRHHRAHEKRW